MHNYERHEVISYNNNLKIVTYKVTKNKNEYLESLPLVLTAYAVKALQEKGVKIIK